VEIQSIAAAPSGSQVKLTWTTVNEETLFGFNVLRSESMDGPRAKVNEHLIVAQRPGQFAGGMYEFTDAVTPGVRYYYWLEVNETGDANSWAFGPATFNVTRIPLVVMIP
jgi:hypothetical protein